MLVEVGVNGSKSLFAHEDQEIGMKDLSPDLSIGVGDTTECFARAGGGVDLLTCGGGVSDLFVFDLTPGAEDPHDAVSGILPVFRFLDGVGPSVCSSELGLVTLQCVLELLRTGKPWQRQIVELQHLSFAQSRVQVLLFLEPGLGKVVTSWQLLNELRSDIGKLRFLDCCVFFASATPSLEFI